jgi:hypothetical protein
MSREDESRYKGISSGGGPTSETARMLALCGCIIHGVLDARTNTTSACGDSYLSAPRKGTVFRSARTVLLQQAVCTNVRTGPSVGDGVHAQAHRSLAIMGHTYNANGSPMLKMAKSTARADATKIFRCLRRIKESKLSDIVR